VALFSSMGTKGEGMETPRQPGTFYMDDSVQIAGFSR